MKNRRFRRSRAQILIPMRAIFAAKRNLPRLIGMSGRAITAVPHAGLSGAAVKPVALRMVHEVAGAVDLPIIGMGGIESAWDVIEFMSVGASAVMVGSKNLTDPFICKKIIEELPGVLSEIGVSDIKSIIGRTDRCAR